MLVPAIQAPCTLRCKQFYGVNNPSTLRCKQFYPFLPWIALCAFDVFAEMKVVVKLGDNLVIVVWFSPGSQSQLLIEEQETEAKTSCPGCHVLGEPFAMHVQHVLKLCQRKGTVSPVLCTRYVTGLLTQKSQSQYCKYLTVLALYCVVTSGIDTHDSLPNLLRLNLKLLAAIFFSLHHTLQCLYACSRNCSS